MTELGEGGMKRVFWLAPFLVGVLVSHPAEADDENLCCNLASEDVFGACVASGSSCPLPEPYGVALSDVAGDGGGFPLPAGATNPSFPTGTDGYLSWTKKAPWLGFCLDAPSAKDPKHAGPTEPIGCLTVSLAPGVGAELETLQFPIDARWDGYQICYGAPRAAGVKQYGPDGGSVACANVNDAFNQTVSPTPVSGSCCGAARLLTAGDVGSNRSEWSVTLTEELPGIPPPVVAYSPDGGIVLSFNPDAGDYLGSPPDACLAAYGESKGCGTPPQSEDTDAATKCKPTTCAEQQVLCGQLSDGCGGTLNCASNCSSQAKGCDAGGRWTPTDESRAYSWPLFVTGLTVACGIRRRRRGARLESPTLRSRVPASR
jgi:hypothetical protein